MPIVKVKAPEQASAYDIHIGHGLLKNAATLLAMCRGRRAMIVTDENVAPLYLDTLKAQLELAGAQTHAFILPAGETTKCMAQLERIYDALIDVHITRKDFVIALGGGVVGDITGYAACTYLRGARRRLAGQNPKSAAQRFRLNRFIHPSSFLFGALPQTPPRT